MSDAATVVASWSYRLRIGDRLNDVHLAENIAALTDWRTLLKYLPQHTKNKHLADFICCVLLNT